MNTANRNRAAESIPLPVSAFIICELRYTTNVAAVGYYTRKFTYTVAISLICIQLPFKSICIKLHAMVNCVEFPRKKV